MSQNYKLLMVSAHPRKGVMLDWSQLPAPCLAWSGFKEAEPRRGTAPGRADGVMKACWSGKGVGCCGGGELDGNRDDCPEVKAGLCEREGRDRRKRDGEREERQQGWRQ